MKISIKSFGPEITSLLNREKLVEVEPGSSVDDLIRKLEEYIKAEHKRTVKILESPFTILINGCNLETLMERVLKKGDIVTILSPIGGG